MLITSASRSSSRRKLALESKVFQPIPGGVSVIKLLNESNILAFVGTESNEGPPRNKVIVWDVAMKKSVAELAMSADVKDILIRRDCLIVILQRQIVLYDLENLQKFACFDTDENSDGLCAVSTRPESLFSAALQE